MPRRTRSASKSKTPNHAGTPQSRDAPISHESSLSVAPKRPKRRMSQPRDDCDAPTQKITRPPAKVIGSRMSSVKHSGLLAKDQEKM